MKSPSMWKFRAFGFMTIPHAEGFLPTSGPPTSRRDDFELIESALTAQEAQQEARRCLRCDHFGYGGFKGGRSKQW